ncbi:MAG: hypothetical protein FJ280_11050 [Planctomycetes bacterium]|nr:hypothetical protein [Planctomycetota bacterium]
MSRRWVYAVSVAMLVSWGAVSWGQQRDFDIPVVGKGPVIDGEMDEIWSVASIQYMTISIGEGPPSNKADCSGSFRALHDAEFLYVLVDVNDESQRRDNPLADGWQDDSVEFYFDGNNSKGAQGAIEPDDFQYRFNWNPEEPDTYFYEYFHRPQSLVGVQYMMVETKTGYRFEIKLPWSTLMVGGAAPMGKLVGIDCFINDDDDGGGRDHQVAWHATAGTGWNTPGMWGTALVVAPLKATGPSPRNGATDVVMPLFRWTPGQTALFHNVYMGKTPDLGPEHLAGPRQVLAMFYYALGLEPGTTYYWRVDEIEKDGVTTHTGDVWSFIAQPKTAYKPTPADGTNTVSPGAALTWLAGSGPVAKHRVYLSDSRDAVGQGKAEADKGTVTETTFQPAAALQGATTYYWRVDEVGPDGSALTGAVWSFTTVVPIDDFESYTDKEGNRIYETWIDGWTNKTGSVVGNLVEPFAEQRIVHGGKQSMPLEYNNVSAPFYSEAELSFATRQDWTAGGTDTLVLYLRGRSANKAAPVYVALKDSSNRTAAVTHPDAAMARALEWTEWQIPLSSFTGVNAAAVRALYLGAGDKANPVAGGTGVIYVDDIGLAKPAPAVK